MWHRICIIFNTHCTLNYVQKYGHFPSLDSYIEESLSQYNNYLPNDSKDLQCALKLHNQGFHIGSFAYLRRVFERQIIREFEEHKSEFNIDDVKFCKKYKMGQKIDLLKDYLPPFIITNKELLYPLLSEGIHKWTDDECAKSFSMVYQAIILILDEIVNTIIRKQKENDLTVAMSELKTKCENVKAISRNSNM
jgi:hypothetical protein